MNLKELHSFKLSDAVTFHNELNPKLWNKNLLRPEVKKQLKIIADDFLQELGISGLDVKDITISGSNAAYSYTQHSDLDLHILVDMSDMPNNDVYRELFNAKKTIYNDMHDIKIHGIPVELYVQDSREPVISLGEYSVMNDDWKRIPTKRRSDFDQTATKQKYNKILSLIEIALKSRKYSKVKHIIDTIKRYRQAGLDKGGEFGPENLAYKMLRSQGYITKLYDLRDKLHSEKLTVETMYKNITDEDYDPNGPPPGPETKPTMPRGTVRVDVSDVYDWYKLGQNISNLDRVDPKIFGKGPPSTIVSFGDENTEHKYIDKLKKLGLTTTDIDPVDPNQPKSMPRQKVDPTYNVNEDEENHNSKLDEILYKLCNIVKKEIKEKTGEHAVAACIIDPDNRIVAKTSKDKHGRWIHAEHNAIDTYENKYGEVPEGSIIVTTLSPCNEYDDKTSDERFGESCTDYINSKGIKKVYCGYMDPTQDNFNREFNIIETSDKDIRHKCKQFADTFLKKEINEAFDQPYPLKWETSDYGDVDALARLPDGSPLSIMFNQQQDNDGEAITQVEFYRNNSQEVTGEGDAQRIFATVLTAIQKYIKKYKPLRLTFSASKLLDPSTYYDPDEPVPNPESRAKLYDRLVQRYARAWGYRAFRADNGDLVIYELSRIQKQKAVGEDYTMQFASEKTPPVSPYAGVKDNQYRGGISEVVDNDFLHSIEAGADQTMEINGYSFRVKNSTNLAGRQYSPGIVVNVYDNKNLIGWADFILHQDKKDAWLESHDTEVVKKYQNKGIATMMYAVVKSLGFDIKPSNSQSTAGSQMWKKWGKDAEHLVKEASGYIPSEKQKNDPRFKTALTVDVHPDSIKKNAKAFYWNTSRAGIPPTAKANGKI